MRLLTQSLLSVAVAAGVASAAFARPADSLLVVVVKGKYGYIDHAGQVVIEPQFIWANDFLQGLGTVYVCGRTLSVDSSGKLHKLRRALKGEWEPEHLGAKVAYVDASGKIRIKPQFEDGLPFSEGLAAVQVGGKWGFINSDGTVVIPPTFDEAYYFHDGVGVVRMNSNFAVIDRSGGILAQGFDFIDLVSYNRIPVVQKSEFGYLDAKGNIVIPLVYDSGSPFFSGLAKVVKGKKIGYIDVTGKVAIPFQFDQAGDFYGGLASARSGTKRGFIDNSGKFAFLLSYDYASGFLYGDVSRFWTEDGKFGYVNSKGKVIWGPTEGSPDHWPLLGWSKAEEEESCTFASDSMRKQALHFSADKDSN